MLTYGTACSGIEAPTVAWEPLGWRASWFSEIEPFCCDLLTHHYPAVSNLGDALVRADPEPADLFMAGFPCQDLSVAGDRKGLVDDTTGLPTRSGLLFFAVAGLADRSSKRWSIFENVLGLLSSKQGRDFALVVGTLSGLRVDVPAEGWGSAGVVAGSLGLVEWRVLDAQYVRVDGYERAVPQQRRRVFIVRDSGDWRSRAPVLLERAGLRGDSPPRRTAGERIAASLTPGAHSGGFNGQDTGNIVLTVEREASFALNGGGQGRDDGESQTFVLQEAGKGTQSRGGQHGKGYRPGDVCYALQANAQHGIVSPCLRTNQDNNSDPGMNARMLVSDTTQVTSAGNYSRPSPGEPCHPLAAGQHAPAVVFQTRIGRNGRGQPKEITDALLSNKDGSRADVHPHVAYASTVRRLTPRECERLQGFPDDYTLISYRGKLAKDAPRYRALGNSIAVNCLRWIGRRIEMALRS